MPTKPAFRNQRVRVHVIENSVVIEDLASGSQHGFVGVDAAVCRLIDGRRTVADLHALMKRTVGDDVGRDIIARVLERLEQADLIIEGDVDADPHGLPPLRQRMVSNTRH